MDWEHLTNGGFTWAGPYYDDEDDPENRLRHPLLEVNVAEWRVETMEDATRYTLQIEWPSFLEAGLVLHSDAGACGMPTLACSLSAPDLRR